MLIHYGFVPYSLLVSSWMDSLFENILLAPTFYNSCKWAKLIYCDSMATLTYSKDPKYHDETKHIDTISLRLRDNCRKSVWLQSYIYYSYNSRASEQIQCKEFFSK